MKSVTLKGKGKNYYLEINSDSSFQDVLQELQSLLQELKTKLPPKSFKTPIIINSQRRLLKPEQLDKIKQIIADFSIFEFQKVICDVWEQKKVKSLLAQNFLNIETKIIRSGKVESYQGNLLLLGDVHQGAQVRASGDVYVVGNVEGIIQAGFPNHNDSIITGNLNKASQVRISDLVQIIADIDDLNKQSLFYVNDLHVLSHTDVTNLNEIKPRREIVIE